jgi:hypothetical protein
VKLFENFARQSPEKNIEERGADAGDLTLDTFNVPMNAISISMRLRIFSKTAVRFPKFYAR